MIDPQTVAEKIYNVLKGFGLVVNKYNTEGKITIDTAEARRFAVPDPNILVRFSPETQTITLQSGPGGVEEKIRKMLQMTADDNLYNFDYRRFNKNIAPRGEGEDVARQQEKDVAEVMEGFGSMYGSGKTSYQPLADNVKLVVRHRGAVNEETRGARSRNIKEIYVQRGDERFRLPENNLSAARAMARHVQQGGEVFDSIGESIMNMATEQRKLKEFVNYVNKRGLVNESNSEYVQLATESIQDIRETFKRLAGVKSYANAVEHVQSRSSVESLQEEDDIEGAFTETHFDDRVAEAIESIRAARGRSRAYESAVTKAIATESFANFRTALAEGDVLTFENDNEKLAHRVKSLGMCTESSVLRSFLNNVSSKISEGKKLSAFESTSVKGCLGKLNQTTVTESKLARHPLARYYSTLAKYDF